ncbi:MAG: putative oxidoreductase [Acidimicrobiales bacterium]|jgi:phosphoglycerate dehydrogenase-like enzyme|nr:putative oxidoreductase [Acidimicrobiales bacterium]
MGRLNMHVVVAYPPQPAGALLDRLRAVSADVDVMACAYVEDHGRRTARGTGDAAALAANPAPELTPEQRDAFATAEAVMTLDLPVDVRKIAPNLRWVQAIGAGVDHLRTALAGESIVLTNAAGVAAVPIAEFVIGRILGVWKRFGELDDQQRRHEWSATYGRELDACTIGLVGLGAIGEAVGVRARALGMRVLAVRRNAGTPSPAADEVFGTERLHVVLARSDAVVLSAPSTDETRDLFDRETFAAMKPGATFCNVARGALVDEAALVDALESGQLGAAIIDVTKQEPLPAGSPLWDAPNIFLSPHSAASPERYLERLFALFEDNLGRFVRGEPMRNVVDLTAGY